MPSYLVHGIKQTGAQDLVSLVFHYLMWCSLVCWISYWCYARLYRKQQNMSIGCLKKAAYFSALLQSNWFASHSSYNNIPAYYLSLVPVWSTSLICWLFLVWIKTHFTVPIHLFHHALWVPCTVQTSHIWWLLYWHAVFLLLLHSWQLLFP